MLQKLLLALITVLGLYYIFFLETIHESFIMVFKLLPMILIILLSIMSKAEKVIPYKTLLTLGLIFCAFGDYTLQWFVIGLVCFLIGHLFYIRAFLTSKVTAAPLWMTICLVIYGGFMLFWIGGSLIGAEETILAIAVAVYMIVILVMGWSSFRAGSKFAFTGALLFIISDSILAIDHFLFPVEYSHQLIMLTYYSAQVFIALSIPKYSAIQSEVLQ